jgi:UDP-N-acetylmuramate dehydrogenase
MMKPEGNHSYTQKFETSVDLSDFNTLGVPAKAQLYTEITNKLELAEIAASGLFDHQKWFVFGGGSNVLFKSDLDRPVLRMAITGIEVTNESEIKTDVCIGAGVEWHSVVEWAVERNLGGVENLALIPGTAGAAPIQNIGAYGTELADVFEELEFFDIEKRKFKKLKKHQCRFGYRDSIFKHELKDKAIITSITLGLTPGSRHTVNNSYGSLKQYLEKTNVDSPEIRDIFDAVVAVRNSKLPDPKMLGNAGSFFKNPVVDGDMRQTLADRFPDLPSYTLDDGSYKIPAGWLIDKAGWRGKKIGNVGCYKNQALVIVNYGGATGKEILEFARMIQISVRDKFGIDLMPEVNIID